MKNNFAKYTSTAVAMAALTVFAGCPSSKDSGSLTSGDAPVFTLAWSEYPSWSVFGVADEEGLIDGDEGAMGTLEEKWNVDIVLKQTDYDTCIGIYGSGEADAVCITNMDALGPSVSKSSVAILPTSTSDGADACIAVGVESIEELKGKKTFGLEKSVSQYCFERVLEMKGQTPAEFEFGNMDPAQAAQNMVNEQDNMDSIMVWNPFVMQTLRKRNDAKVIFDSTSIPEEIVDMVVCSQSSLKKPGGDRFAYAIIEAFYAVSDQIEEEATADETLLALAEKFVSGLSVEDMQTIVTQTKFYKTPAAAQTIFNKESFQKETMPTVVEFCLSHDILEEKPSIGFNDESAALNFSTKYIDAIADGVKP